MDSAGETAEFEALGETEVARRLRLRAFSEPTRARATRWLNAVGMAKLASAQAEAGRQLLSSEAVAAARVSRRWSALAIAMSAAAMLISGTVWVAGRTAVETLSRRQDALERQVAALTERPQLRARYRRSVIASSAVSAVKSASAGAPEN